MALLIDRKKTLNLFPSILLNISYGVHAAQNNGYSSEQTDQTLPPGAQYVHSSQKNWTSQQSPEALIWFILKCSWAPRHRNYVCSLFQYNRSGCSTIISRVGSLLKNLPAHYLKLTSKYKKSLLYPSFIFRYSQESGNYRGQRGH